MNNPGYQFWQAEKKEKINRSEIKIGADELPAVTQLFTEDYMVFFLLHNTLGAWWAGKVLAKDPALATSAENEEELRAACKVGDVDWHYLRFVRDKSGDGNDGPWRPAAGMFDGWPNVAKDLTVLDPCMGSGHFLVFALPILVAFRMVEERLCETDAVDAVLLDNLFGLEIDPRCTQIAAFNLAFAAWRRTGFHVLPPLNLACSGLSIGVTKAEWLRLAEKSAAPADPQAKRDLLGTDDNLLTHGLEQRVRNGFRALYDLFAKAPWLGSLIDPLQADADIFREGFDRLKRLLASILASTDTDEMHEMAVAAQGMAAAAELLGRHFSLVATNVPYLGRGKQDDIMRDYCERAFSRSKADLSTCFVERCLSYCVDGGTSALVTPQNWLFLGSYKKMRDILLRNCTWEIVCRLGERGFWSSQAGHPQEPRLERCIVIQSRHGGAAMNPESLFSLSDHLERLSEDGDPLEVLEATVDFEYFRGWLVAGLGYGDGSKGGRPPYDPVAMFKVLIVQTQHNLSDAKMEFMIRDRLSWMRFFGFALGDAMPDENTIRHFRNRMTETGTLKRVMKAFDRQLHKKGYIPMSGQIVDASLVPAPRQRNTEDEKAAIKEGKSAHEIWPDEPNKAAQKDTDARWTLKVGGKVRYRPDGTPLPQIAVPVFGYKSHISIDRRFGFIREGTTTSASGADGRELKNVVSKDNTAGDVWADSAYRSKSNEKWLARNMMTSRIHRRKPAGKPMPVATSRANAKKSSVRAVVEHVFAHQKNRYGLFIRTIGLAHAEAKLTLANIAYNFDRLIFHERQRAMG